MTIIVFKDKSHKVVDSSSAFEYENDSDYFTSINMPELIDIVRQDTAGDIQDGPQGERTIEQQVFIALGAASMCWTETPKGTFKDTEATHIGRQLIESIEAYVKKKSPADYVGLVKEFHETFDHPVLAFPQLPAQARMDLRYNLLKEEVNELHEAILNKDLVGIADALMDIQYVTSGAILEFGMGEASDLLFFEVHRSNMSKACISYEEAKETAQEYFESTGMICSIHPKEGRFLVFRDSDKKTIKSKNYSPAMLKELISIFSAEPKE